MITHHLHPFPYTIQVLEGSHSPLESGVSWVPELEWNEDHYPLLYAFEAMVGGQHHAESQCLCGIDSSRLGSLSGSTTPGHSVMVSTQIHKGRGRHKAPNSLLLLRKNAWLGATSTLVSQHAKKVFKKMVQSSMSPTCRFEHQYTKPTPTYGMPPQTVGTTMYI